MDIEFLIGSYFLSIQGDIFCCMDSNATIEKSNIILIHDPGYKWPVFLRWKLLEFSLW